jgi:hypothetical protein
MGTPKVKANAITSGPAVHHGEPFGSEDLRTAKAEQFSAVVGAIAKRYGVKVASTSIPLKNPYAMSAEQAEEVALRAGIITRAGNLTRRFK